jgi:competence protein ComEC
MDSQGELQRDSPPARNELPSSSGRIGGAVAATPKVRAVTGMTVTRILPPYQPLVSVAFAVAAGIVLSRYCVPLLSAAQVDGGWYDIGFGAWWCLGSSSLFLWWLLWQSRHDRLAAAAILFAAGFCGAAWHELQWSRFQGGEIGRYARVEAQPACLEAIARETPDRVSAPQETPLRAIPTGERSRLIVQVTAIRDGTAWQRVDGNCQLTVNGHLLGVRAGDRLRIFGQLARPAPPLNPGEFDFAQHARADRQLARLRSSAPECVRILQPGPALSLVNMLEVARSACKRLIWEFVGPERSGLAAAILLGAREGLTYDQTEPYLVTGTIHVLVVSGMNVAILAAGLLGMMRVGWIARRAGLAVIIGVVVFYTLLAELQPPVVRAAVFGILLCIAAWTGRHGVAFNSLAAAALVVLAINPADLFRPGPQLSFLAVMTLVWIGRWSLLQHGASSDRIDAILTAAQPWYVQWLGVFGRWTGLLLLTSLAIWLTTLPLVLLHFHVASPVAVVISPVVWLLVFVAMWSGFALLTLGWLIPAVGSLCGVACDWSLGALESVVAWAEALPAGHFWAPGPACWWVLVFYLALLMVMILGRALAPARWQLAVLCAWLLVGLAPPLVRTISRDGLECSFVAVGHGACVVLEAPTGETLVYDAGALGSPEIATQSIASYLWHRGIMRIDGLVISHADIDHYNAVPGLLERFRVGTVYVSPSMFDGFGETNDPDGPEVLRAAIGAAGVSVREIWAGDKLQFGPEVTLHVLHPPRNGVIGSDNANSITLAAEYCGRRVLLPGDLESPGLDDVMAELPFDCDVILAPHHGSRQSDPPGFAAWSTPEWVVISGVGRDEVEPVVATYRRAGADVLQTNYRGTVQFSLLGGSLSLSTWQTVDGNPKTRR